MKTWKSTSISPQSKFHVLEMEMVYPRFLCQCRISVGEVYTGHGQPEAVHDWKHGSAAGNLNLPTFTFSPFYLV